MILVNDDKLNSNKKFNHFKEILSKKHNAAMITHVNVFLQCFEE